MTHIEHHRRSIRLKGYDYSQPGSYFITLVTWQRECLFGQSAAGGISLSKLGKIVASEWKRLLERFPFLELDEWVVMPNHLHGILIITESGGRGTGDAIDYLPPPGWPESVAYDPRAPTPPTPTHEQFGAPAAGSIPTIIRSFKSSVTQRARWARIDGPVWQRNYYERVIRNERELDAVRLYIQDNPRQWGEDGENPGR